MRIRHQELEIDEENPFSTCKLDRKKYADILTDIVGSYPDGFVLAINNEWGTGKTTFVKMWQQHLINKNYKTVYFNAWENDFDLNPIVAIMAELKTLTERSTQRLFKNVTEKGAALTKAVLPAVVKAATKRYFDTDEITSAVEGVAKAAADVFDDEIKAYKKKKESISGFRDQLETFVKKTSSDKPIIFTIDELDRCRPDYAVEVLEQMKHFFSVPGITFVLSIDKNHLAASVRGFYGSEQINTDEYLRRFIDLEYSIPAPTPAFFFKYLYHYYEFDGFFKSPNRRNSDFRDEAKNFLTMVEYVFEKQNVTLRQQEKIFGQIRLILTSFGTNYSVFPEILFILVYVKTVKPSLYSRIKSNELSLQELSDEYAQLVPNERYGPRFLLYIEAALLIFYNNQLTRKDPELVKREGDEVTSSIRSKVAWNDQNHFFEALDYVGNNWNYGGSNLTYLLKKIELTEPIVFSE